MQCRTAGVCPQGGRPPTVGNAEPSPPPANGVYPDYATGNWSEGLTTFLADYAFKEEEGPEAARAMRLAWLRDYAAVPAERDRALAAFVSRRHGADQAVGYNKTAFVFLMLRDLIGEERFTAALRSCWQNHRGRVASWADIERAFAAASASDLRGYFQQWVHRAGAPALRIDGARRDGAGGARVSVRIEQESPAYELRVPVRYIIFWYCRGFASGIMKRI